MLIGTPFSKGFEMLVFVQIWTSGVS